VVKAYDQFAWLAGALRPLSIAAPQQRLGETRRSTPKLRRIRRSAGVPEAPAVGV